MVRWLVVAVTLASPGEHTHGATCHHPEDAKAAQATSSEAVVRRGAPLRGEAKVTLEALLASPEAYAGKKVQVEGTVRRACTRKGCWMELSKSPKGQGVRVTFKDYGFFVPLDSAGKSATVEGEVKVASLSEAQAKHYESEGATVPRGAEGAAKEVQLVATSVELRAPAPTRSPSRSSP